MWPDNRLCDLFLVDHPIIQAPMTGSSSLEMALEVGAAGGLGSLACAALDADQLRDLLSTARSKTDKPLNVNFFAHAAPNEGAERNAAWLEKLARYYTELDLELPQSLAPGQIQPFDAARCEVIEAMPPAVVSFHFGLPEGALLTRLKAAGCKIISSATTVSEARWLAAQGCDAIIAQGYEAGGHRGMFQTESLNSQMGTLALVPQIVDAVDVPVIAAGGIGDARAIIAAFALGASGVQLGTAYLFTHEASISPLYRQALQDAAISETALCNIVSGRPTRVMVNRLVAERGPISADAPEFPNGFGAIGPLRSMAEARGSRDFSAHYCGQAAALGRKTSAFDLTRDLATAALHYFSAQSPSAR